MFLHSVDRSQGILELIFLEKDVDAFAGVEVTGDCPLGDEVLDFMNVASFEFCQFDGRVNAVCSAVVMEVEEAASTYMSTYEALDICQPICLVYSARGKGNKWSLVTVTSCSSAAELSCL